MNVQEVDIPQPLVVIVAFAIDVRQVALAALHSTRVPEERGARAEALEVDAAAEDPLNSQSRWRRH